MNDFSKKNDAIKLFINNTEFEEKDIKKIKKIHKGYTNISFLFICKNKEKFQVRLGHNNEIVNRENELNVNKFIPYDYFLYMDNNGNVIKKWIKGRNPLFLINKKKQLKLLINEIEKIHSIDIKNSKILTHNYYEFCTDFIKENYKEQYIKYENILKKYDLENTVFSHNDINPWNIILQKNQIILIDFEWARKNNIYWDYANFFRESNLSSKWAQYIVENNPKLDLSTFWDFVYVSIFYALMWTYSVDQSKKVNKYRKKILKKLKIK